MYIFLWIHEFTALKVFLWKKKKKKQFPSLSNKQCFGNLVKKKLCSLMWATLSIFISHTLSSLLDIPPQHTHTHTPLYNLPSCVCPWTLIIDAHNIFSCIPIDPLIETSLICSLLLDIFSSPVSFFSKLWQAVQILAVCCSPLILRQTFLLHKYTRISEKMQSDIRWPQRHSSLWYTVFKIVRKKGQLLRLRLVS